MALSQLGGELFERDGHLRHSFRRDRLLCRCGSLLDLMAGATALVPGEPFLAAAAITEAATSFAGAAVTLAIGTGFLATGTSFVELAGFTEAAPFLAGAVATFLAGGTIISEKMLLWRQPAAMLRFATSAGAFRAFEGRSDRRNLLAFPEMDGWDDSH
jgi:hypothetical protein